MKWVLSEHTKLTPVKAAFLNSVRRLHHPPAALLNVVGQLHHSPDACSLNVVDYLHDPPSLWFPPHASWRSGTLPSSTTLPRLLQYRKGMRQLHGVGGLIEEWWPDATKESRQWFPSTWRVLCICASVWCVLCWWWDLPIVATVWGSHLSKAASLPVPKSHTLQVPHWCQPCSEGAP